jgi:hypothetical protein
MAPLLAFHLPTTPVCASEPSNSSYGLLWRPGGIMTGESRRAAEPLHLTEDAQRYHVN